MFNLSSHDVKRARKAHVCDWCLRRIEPGEPYRYSFVVDGGDSWSWYECKDCQPYVEEMRLEDEWYASDVGYTTSDFMEWMEENHPGALPHRKGQTCSET